MTTIQDIIAWYQKKGNRIIPGKTDKSQVITGARAITSATATDISFINKKYISRLAELIGSANCRILLVEEQLLDALGEKDLPDTIAYVITKDPKSQLIEFCKHFLGFQQPVSESAIHPTAIISEKAKIGKNVTIEAFVVIEDDVVIGDQCIIGHHTVIRKSTVIGNQVEIGSCTVIGGVGFGYSRNEQGIYEQFPHYGAVILKDHVHIGNNTCIDRGSLSDTIIEEGVKIDNLVHIAHNVRIGKNTLVIANAMIGGSAEIGDNCWIAPASCIRNGIRIGNDVVVGLSSNVTRNIPDGQTVLGNPAMPQDDFFALLKQQKKMMDDQKDESSS